MDVFQRITLLDPSFFMIFDLILSEISIVKHNCKLLQIENFYYSILFFKLFDHKSITSMILFKAFLVISYWGPEHCLTLYI